MVHAAGAYGVRSNAGIDRILCNHDAGAHACGHGESRPMKNPVTGAQEPCQQAPFPEYCTTREVYHMNDRGSWIAGWTSRFFVREATPLTPETIAEITECVDSGRYWSDSQSMCTDQQPNGAECRVRAYCSTGGAEDWGDTKASSWGDGRGYCGEEYQNGGDPQRWIDTCGCIDALVFTEGCSIEINHDPDIRYDHSVAVCDNSNPPGCDSTRAIRIFATGKTTM
jgi:hypothetical protein